MNILVTGGAGYIGSHTCVELLNSNHTVIVVDNLTNSKKESLERVKQITGKEVLFYELDLQDKVALAGVFTKHQIDSVIHFAGLKAVGESVQKPLLYYRNNLVSTIMLCEVMKEHSVTNLIFSSSATVYGNPQTVPITEDFPLSATNPYGRTKLMLEEILTDWCVSDSSISVTLLRYFNPIGAHESGLIGEDPNGTPNNLMPYISQVAIGKLPKLMVFGNDWETPDGTGVRDYIHVVDLAKGHVAAVEKRFNKAGVTAYNLGSGKGVSVFELLHAFEKETGVHIPYEIGSRRPGDIATCFANATKANTELNWHTVKTLEDMCRDSWKWQSENPNGYN